MAQDIKVMILGGVRENGKNMYAVQVDDEIFILDAGLKYPDTQLLGIDYVIPDLSFIEDNADKIMGVFLTHGHADAIGALPYFITKYDIPVFGSKLTIELAKIAVRNAKKNADFSDFHEIDQDTAIDFKNATVSFFDTTHNIPQTLGVAIKTDAGQIVYTGDFKFDQSVNKGYKTNYGRIMEIGKEGVLALLSDSSNAEMPHEGANEKEIGDYIIETLKDHPGRVIVSAVASNIARVQQILNAAHLSNRKVILTGQDVAKIVRTAMDLDLLHIPDEDLIIPATKINDYDKEDILVLETGRMGEPLKSLQRMAMQQHKLVNITDGDLVFITTTPSHSMETTVAKTSDLIYRAGGVVKEIGREINASGHASRYELQMMINLLNPQYLFPIQGEYRLLAAHKEAAQETGIDSSNIIIAKKGDVYHYQKGQFELTEPVSSEDTMIDGAGIGDIGNIVLRDRKILADDGMFIAVVTIDRKKKKIVAQPKVMTRGFVYIKENKDLIYESIELTKEAIDTNLQTKKFDWSELKQDVRHSLEKYLFQKTKRRPVVLPVIMEVNQNRHRRNANKPQGNKPQPKKK
ncbi:ribonuclease J [Holzapfeliella sp. JNUCC 80]